MRRHALLTLALLLAATSQASHAWCEPSTSEPDFDTGPTAAGRYYFDNDPCPAGCLFGVWLYQESNGMDGLQRQDVHVDDTCSGEYAGDTIIF